jgi:hypothetical protein
MWRHKAAAIGPRDRFVEQIKRIVGLAVSSNSSKDNTPWRIK